MNKQLKPIEKENEKKKREKNEKKNEEKNEEIKCEDLKFSVHHLFYIMDNICLDNNKYDLARLRSRFYDIKGYFDRNSIINDREKVRKLAQEFVVSLITLYEYNKTNSLINRVCVYLNKLTELINYI